jgi:hypothetical protein
VLLLKKNGLVLVLLVGEEAGVMFRLPVIPTLASTMVPVLKQMTVRPSVLALEITLERSVTQMT